MIYPADMTFNIAKNNPLILESALLKKIPGMSQQKLERRRTPRQNAVARSSSMGLVSPRLAAIAMKTFWQWTHRWDSPVELSSTSHNLWVPNPPAIVRM